MPGANAAAATADGGVRPGAHTRMRAQGMGGRRSGGGIGGGWGGSPAAEGPRWAESPRRRRRRRRCWAPATRSTSRPAAGTTSAPSPRPSPSPSGSDPPAAVDPPPDGGARRRPGPEGGPGRPPCRSPRGVRRRPGPMAAAPLSLNPGIRGPGPDLSRSPACRGARRRGSGGFRVGSAPSHGRPGPGPGLALLTEASTP